MVLPLANFKVKNTTTKVRTKIIWPINVAFKFMILPFNHQARYAEMTTAIGHGTRDAVKAIGHETKEVINDIKEDD